MSLKLVPKLKEPKLPKLKRGDLVQVTKLMKGSDLRVGSYLTVVKVIDDEGFGFILDDGKGTCESKHMFGGKSYFHCVKKVNP